MVRELGSALIGRQLTDYTDRPFPLLIKYLFPSQALSVQVHPNDEYARKEENSNGKTEMWLVLDATPESFIIVGWKAGLSKDQIVGRLLGGDFQSVMNFIQPRIGDVYFIPAGTVHALGPGVGVLEIQQNSDVTYRLYDWDRVEKDGKARPLHMEKALKVLNFDHVPEYRIAPVVVSDQTATCSYLCACRYFAACIWNLKEAKEFASDPSRFWVLNVVDGQGWIVSPPGDPIWGEKGATLLIPASQGEFTIEPSGYITFVKSWVPDLEKDIVFRLRSLGFSDSEIIGLGGVGIGNDLLRACNVSGSAF